MSRGLADLLLKDKLITSVQHAEAVEAAKTGSSHALFLIEKRYVPESKLVMFLSQKFSLPTINLARFDITSETLKSVPLEVVKKAQAIPIQLSGGVLVVAICDPTMQQKLEQIKFAVKMNVEVVLAGPTAFSAAFAKYYGGSAELGAAIQTYKKEQSQQTETNAGDELELVTVHEIGTSNTEDVPVIQLVNGVLVEAIRRGASDIHVEPYEKRFRVRLRIDGTMFEVADVPLTMKRSVVARLKIMSRMDIAESRVPQDGRIKLRYAGQEIDFRVNSMPTLFGEKIVLRMLNKNNLALSLIKIGFEKEQLDIFKKGIYAPNGLVLVTGPTGSGKTTTLYSALSDLNQVSDNISTAEDPVEYNLDGVNQVQIQKDIGLTFASVLRALLRQDPDIILVGEIRDFETAEVAVQAALTGHLVLSTLHTNDAASTITRLMNMGLEPFLVVASVNTIVAQRLLRTICNGCKMPYSLPIEKIMALEKDGSLGRITAQEFRLYKGTGCAQCGKTGYKGRVAIYEVLEFTAALKEMVLKNESNAEIKKQAMRQGMATLRQSAMRKVHEGVTTLEEAIATTSEG